MTQSITPLTRIFIIPAPDVRDVEVLGLAAAAEITNGPILAEYDRLRKSLPLLPQWAALDLACQKIKERQCHPRYIGETPEQAYDRERREENEWAHRDDANDYR